MSAATRLRPPPYGRELAAARREGRHVNPWILCGRDAWEIAARRGPGRLVLPHGDDPNSFDWRVVAGLVPVVRWPGASVPECDELGAALVRAGAAAALVLDDLRVEEGRFRVARAFRRYVPRRAA